MEINNLLNYIKSDTSRLPQPLQFNFGVNCPAFAPLKKDTVSFKGIDSTEKTKTPKTTLKKSDFESIDFAVIEKFKINPQQLKSKEDLQEFAKKEIKKLQNKDFGGRTEEAKTQRKAMLKEWFNYLINENNDYSNTQKLIILSAITKNLRPNTDEIPEVLNKDVLAKTITDLEERLKSNPKENFDFLKMYETNIRLHFTETTSTNELKTGWVIIPSKFKDPENFEYNVKKVQALSHRSWCTKSYNAEPYLKRGDFHVYLEQGHPKLGMHFVENKAVEIEGEKNNKKIPLKYFEILKTHKEENNIEFNKETQNIFEETEKEKEIVKKTQEELGESIKLETIDDAFKVLNYFGNIKVKKEHDGLVLNKYRQLLGDITFEDYGINENKLFKHIKEIEGCAFFNDTNVTDLGNLQRIGKDVFFEDSKVINLGKLKSIGENAYFNDSYIENLGELKYIGREAFFSNSRITDLGNLTIIGGDANFKNSEIENLKNLEIIGGNAYFNDSNVNNLGKLKKIVGLAHYDKSNSNLSEKDFENIEILEQY